MIKILIIIESENIVNILRYLKNFKFINKDLHKLINAKLNAFNKLFIQLLK